MCNGTEPVLISANSCPATGERVPLVVGLRCIFDFVEAKASWLHRAAAVIIGAAFRGAGSSRTQASFANHSWLVPQCGQKVRLKKTGTLPNARQSALMPVEISRAVFGHRMTIVPTNDPPHLLRRCRLTRFFALFPLRFRLSRRNSRLLDSSRHWAPSLVRMPVPAPDTPAARAENGFRALWFPGAENCFRARLRGPAQGRIFAIITRRGAIIPRRGSGPCGAKHS